MTSTDKTNNRRAKGKEIATTPDQITRINDNYYRVKSQSSEKAYNVTAIPSGWYCTCPDHIYRQVCCKHIHAVEFSIKLREEIRQKNSVTISPISVSVCLYCKSDNITKDGLRHNKYGDIQKFYCKNLQQNLSLLWK